MPPSYKYAAKGLPPSYNRLPPRHDTLASSRRRACRLRTIYKLLAAKGLPPSPIHYSLVDATAILTKQMSLMPSPTFESQVVSGHGLPQAKKIVMAMDITKCGVFNLSRDFL